MNNPSYINDSIFISNISLYKTNYSSHIPNTIDKKQVFIWKFNKLLIWYLSVWNKQDAPYVKNSFCKCQTENKQLCNFNSWIGCINLSIHIINFSIYTFQINFKFQTTGMCLFENLVPCLWCINHCLIRLCSFSIWRKFSYVESPYVEKFSI